MCLRSHVWVRVCVCVCVCVCACLSIYAGRTVHFWWHSRCTYICINLHNVYGHLTICSPTTNSNTTLNFKTSPWISPLWQCMYVCMCIYIYICAYVICIYIYIYIYDIKGCSEFVVGEIVIKSPYKYLPLPWVKGASASSAMVPVGLRHRGERVTETEEGAGALTIGCNGGRGGGSPFRQASRGAC